MNLIYIVEPEDMLAPEEDLKSTGSGEPYTPNFTMPGREPWVGAISAIVENKPSLSGVVLESLKAVSPISGLPIALVVAASTVSPLISSMIGADNLSESLKEAKVKEFEAFLIKHGITIRLAEKRGYRFPPGHPQVGKSYMLHPLATLSGADKENVYIPQDNYDETLLAEREAELLRLLVELGATKISITEKATGASMSNFSGGVSAEAKLVGAAKVDGGASSENSSMNLDSREFELMGRPWSPSDRLDRAKFAWVAFEPSWGAMISAREIGECTKAAIEIREETSFSSEKRAALEVKAKLYGGGAGGQIMKGNGYGRTYLIKAEFAPFKPTTIETS